MLMLMLMLRLDLVEFCVVLLIFYVVTHGIACNAAATLRYGRSCCFCVCYSHDCVSAVGAGCWKLTWLLVSLGLGKSSFYRTRLCPRMAISGEAFLLLHRQYNPRKT